MPPRSVPMLIRHAPDLTDNDVTDHSLYLKRRTLMAGIAGLGVAVASASHAQAGLTFSRGFSTTEKPTSKEDITTYNNF
ncbi:MAG: mononuclear molybdenum enzyme YedY, partial [Caulobacter sp.]